MTAMLAGMGGMMAPQPMAQPKPKAGMFGAGKPDWGQALIAGLNGYLAARGNPVGMMGLQQMQAARQQAMEQQQYQQRREDGFQDYVRKQAWEQANPRPVNNDTVADYNFWKSVLSEEEFKQYVANKVNPPQLMNVPGVGIVQIPRMGGPQGAPTAPVGKLTPIEEGGPMPSASGGFHPSGY